MGALLSKLSPSPGFFKLRCLIIGGADVFTVQISPGVTVDELKSQILKALANSYLRETDANDVKLWKVDIPLSDSLDLSAVTAPADESLKDYHNVSNLWPSLPPPCMLHVLITKTDRNAERRSYNPQIQATWCPRSKTVQILYNKLSDHHFIQVRGTPSSGKTTLADLLHQYIRFQQPNAEIYRIESWPEHITGTLDARLDAAGIPKFSTSCTTYLLWDNAELTYSDGPLWEVFLKNRIQRPHGNYFAILFCCYGSASSQPNSYKSGIPLRLEPCARVSLRAQESLHHNHGPCGLLFTFEEFTEVIKRYRGSDRQSIRLDPDLQLQLFNWTAGHAGALADILEIISWQLHDQPSENDLDLDAFFSRHPYPQFITALLSKRFFARGLPVSGFLERPSIVKAFQTLLQCNSISREDLDAQALNECIRNGWVHSDVVDLHAPDSPERFVFPSPLHAACLAWRLIPQNYVCHFQTIHEMSLAVIRKFKPSRLRAPLLVGSSFRDRPIEAVYQDEFYRALYEVTEGATITTPEYSSISGDSLGRINFFIPSKKWGVEILRDGEALPEHHSRFGICGAYGQWIAGGGMEDYVILDFRTTKPTKQCQSLRNLLHVVVEHDFARVSVLDPELVELDTFVLLEN